MRKIINYHDKLYFHPGFYVEQNMLELMAETIGISYEDCEDLINGDLDVDEELAIKLSKAFGTTESFWLNLQDVYDEGLRIMLFEKKGVNRIEQQN